jgi:hypothetical protein
LAVVFDERADCKLFREVQRLNFGRLRIEQLVASLGLRIARILNLHPIRRRLFSRSILRRLPLRDDTLKVHLDDLLEQEDAIALDMIEIE